MFLTLVVFILGIKAMCPLLDKTIQYSLTSLPSALTHNLYRNYCFKAMLLAYFGDSTSTNSSLGLDRGLGVASSKEDKDSRDCSVGEELIIENRVVGTPFDILSETWSHDSADGLTTNQS